MSSAQHTEFALLKVPITEGEKVVLKLVYTLHTLLLSTVGDYAKTKLINLLKLYVGPL